MRVTFASLAFASVFAVLSPTLAGELVVLETRGTTLKSGQAIDDSKPLTLTEGEQVTLVLGDGSVLTLRGPFDKVPAADSGDGGGVVLALDALTTRKAQRNEAGVVRDATVAVHLPDPWLVDVSHAGSMCVKAGENPVFWRASTDGGTLTIMPPDRSWRAEALWPKGSTTMEAPDYFPVRDGRTYLASFGGNPVAVTLNVLPPALGNTRMEAAWMIEKGCIAQAEALIKTVR
ncbi:MAG TPA: hypothetical protein VLX09_11605 [Stellaceae bacterium]|nr:hypothetical protein [Stellaceae bacterium]